MRVEVPGKLVLLGEYAVIDGAPALTMAVDHGVACTVRPSPSRVIHTPDGDDRFVRAALEAVQAPPASYTFSSTHPIPLPGKPGLGGSAAAVVAALAAGGCARSDWTSRGVEVHRAVQGSGSGIDVATSAHGGTLRIQLPTVQPLALPIPLVVYAGQSAKTGPRVERYRAWRGRDDFVQASTELVDRFPIEPIPTVREAWRELCAMAEASGIPYRTEAIDHIVRVAESLGGAAKPSGAGGGDAVVVWVDDPESFVRAMEKAQLPLLPVQPAGAPTIR